MKKVLTLKSSPYSSLAGNLLETSELKQLCTGKKCTSGPGLQGKGEVLSGTKLR